MVKHLLICLLLTGCATTKFVSAPLTPPPKLERPVLEIEVLKAGDPADVVVRAHRVAIKQLQEYAMKLEVLLDAYRN